MMNRRDALKGLAGIATFLTSGVTVAAPPPKPEESKPAGEPPAPILVTFTIRLEDTATTWVQGESESVMIPSSKMIDQVNAMVVGMLAGMDHSEMTPDLTRPVSLKFSGRKMPIWDGLTDEQYAELITQVEHAKTDPDYSVVTDFPAQWMDLPSSGLTMETSDFLKRGGYLVNRGLDLYTLHTARGLVPRPLTLESPDPRSIVSKMELFSRVKQHVRACVEVATIQLWMLPKSA